ncbi:MAG TPA: hypothetical protein VH062_21435 [Polyangiaceae bacterium]|jgi:hypothetical protein|nr:hypothetical protein [Polyangiaceae bacterium]
MQTQMLVTEHPRADSGRFLVMRGDQAELPSALGSVTAAPHPLPLPSGSYADGGGQGNDIARVWLTPADFAALCSCVGNADTALTISHSGSVVTGFTFNPVESPMKAMSRTLEALERRMNELEPESIRAELVALREGMDELLRRMPSPRHSGFVERDGRDDDQDEPVPLVSPSSKRAM